MRFVKMHGCENDYVVIDALDDPICEATARRPEFARVICDRRRGVGADGVLVLTRPESSNVQARMTIINADGSDGGMCGNGARCAVKLLIDSASILPGTDGSVRLEIGGRVIRAKALRDANKMVTSISLDMGPASLDPSDVPFDPSRAEPCASGWKIHESCWHVASIGNPHAVTFLDDPICDRDLARLGPLIATHDAFPERTNVHLVNLETRDSIRMRSWERGCGETRACGSGACAVVSIGIRLGSLDAERPVRVRVMGGELVVRQDERTGSMQLEGPAVRVYEGMWPSVDRT